MEFAKDILVVLLTAILAENFILTKFLGICPFLGVSKKVDTAAGMGMAVIFVMSLAAACAWLVYNLILVPLNITYLYNIAFILLIASLVQFVEMFLKKMMPPLYQSLGVFLPLITTNCAVLGATIQVQTNGFDFLQAIIFGFSAGAGFTLAIVLFAGVRERLESSDIPKSLQGMPIALISASLLAIAFLGFAGMSF